MKWVLIILLMARSYDGGQAIDHIPFASEQLCRDAAASLIDNRQKTNVPYNNFVLLTCARQE